jgi:hypothetical protein
MIDVRENFLPTTLVDKIRQEVESVDFPWYFYNNSIITNKFIQTNRSQFVHTLYTDNAPCSKLFGTFHPFLYFIEDRFCVKIEDIVRIKINLLQSNNDYIMHMPHADVDVPGYATFVYYLNSSDGDTIIYNERKDVKDPIYLETDAGLTVDKKISPIYNRMVRFNSDQYHSYYTPVKSNYRVVINTVLKLK